MSTLKKNQILTFPSDLAPSCSESWTTLNFFSLDPIHIHTIGYIVSSYTRVTHTHPHMYAPLFLYVNAFGICFRLATSSTVTELGNGVDEKVCCFSETVISFIFVSVGFINSKLATTKVDECEWKVKNNRGNGNYPQKR